MIHNVIFYKIDHILFLFMVLTGLLTACVVLRESGQVHDDINFLTIDLSEDIELN